MSMTELLHILLLEDDRGDMLLLQEGMRDVSQYKVRWTVVASLAGALEHLQAGSFDVILMDLNLLDSQGLDTFLKVQAAAEQLPIVVLTGLDDESLAIQAVRGGAQDYVVKGVVAMGLLSRSISYAIERQRLQAELRSLSLRDSLTGLYNRRGFITLAEEQFKLARRNCQALSVILCDMDGLKPINDTFGHASGDRALAAAAEILRATFRESDIIARLGGDEFVILAIGAMPHDAERLKRRLQANLDDFNGLSGQNFDVSLSTGIARLEPEAQTSIEELIVQADQAMYCDKQLRRKTRRI
jgi:diguanylate cyclase (GGDEF)-like protein